MPQCDHSVELGDNILKIMQCLGLHFETTLDVICVCARVSAIESGRRT
jgi:hypothetical protein